VTHLSEVRGNLKGAGINGCGTQQNRTHLTHHGKEEHGAKRGLSGEKSKDLITTSLLLYFLSNILCLLSVEYCVALSCLSV
jgi:hypothetical protein